MWRKGCGTRAIQTKLMVVTIVRNIPKVSGTAGSRRGSCSAPEFPPPELKCQNKHYTARDKVDLIPVGPKEEISVRLRGAYVTFDS
ncbi:hypothetical protein Pcinc_004685 [Petrolisthes cinctipes]|uniref:Uncharacterized protein n=1 Tax=Petrolisthes cinctipes TaxID=88211 RepID=A0AAE1GGB6_PETCI|nr:hypothetical protein Pcinc_004685 [Petrolisthes cinctipes]